jgi:TPR repeat protein
VKLCEKTVADHPKEARLYALLARVRAVAGDAKGALEAARTGAELGSPNARVMYGVMLVEGQHVARDYAAAREQFRIAAKEGSPYAQYNLAAMFANGWGIGVDEADAAAWLLRAANGGDPLAMQVLGQRFDQPRAEHWLRKAAEAMLPEGRPEPLRIANPEKTRIDPSGLLDWYVSRARAGEAWAQAYLGALAESGQWVKQDYTVALGWYRTAGLAGNVPAQWRVARFYNEGWGVAKDPVEARRWGQMWEVKRCEEHERANASANACDRFAADKYDPDSFTPGVDSFCMRHFAQRAIEACTVAVKSSPKTARYRNQLARAYAHTGRFEEARREAALAAKGGSSSAMILMGVMHQRGLGAEKNEREALAWYRKAADAGNPRAMSLLGMPSTPVVAPTMEQMAEKGDPRQQFNVAAQLEREKKYDEAIKWYTRAAEQGFRPAELNLAQMYEKGIGVKQDPTEARKRYRRLSELGDNEARYRAAKLAADAQDYKEALGLYERLVRDDEVRAMLDLGQLHEDGRGVPQNFARAAELYERAAERSPWARAKLGILYLDMNDFSKSRSWLQRSANEGNGASRNNLGLMYDRGLGVPADYRAARDHYLSALAVGNHQAAGNLENLFIEGRGAPRAGDPAAVDWYKRAADAGIPTAQYKLGMIYRKGEGVPRDDQLAAKYLLAAAQQGHVEARKEAGELLYSLGRDEEAAMLGHEAAGKRWAAKMGKGDPRAEAFMNAMVARAKAQVPPPPVFPSGIARDVGADQTRTIAVRVAGVGVAHAAAGDAAIASVYDIIRWFPETDGKKK